MIPGSPLLATWATDGTLRVYEMSGDAFVPLGVVGGLTHDPTLAPAVALPFWTESVVSLIRKDTNTRVEGFDITGNAIANLSLGTLTTQYRAAVGRNVKIFSAWPDASAGVVAFDPDTSAYVAPAGRNFPSGRLSKTAFTISPDARLGAANYVSGGNNILGTYTAQGTDYPWGFVAGATKNLAAFAPDVLRISNDNAHVLAGKVGEFVVRVFAGDTLTELPEIPLLEPLRTFAVSPFGRLLAISTVTGGVYTTKIYRKVGDFYQEIQTLSGVGSLLDFSADGTLLFDAARRLSYRWDAVDREFDLIPNSMDNVTVGSASQAISDHVPVVQTTSQFYQAGVVSIAQQAIDTSMLKFTLLNDTAPAFVASAPTLSAAVGTGEVTDGFWPGGGYNLENFQGVPTGVNMASWLFDNLQHIVLSEPMTFRSAIVYMDDEIDGIPLFRIDFASDITIAPDNRVEFIIATDGLLIFTP